MMYSQQEYDMVRRQTIQMETEKRAVLRLALIVATALLAVTLFLSGILYRRSSVAESVRRQAEAKAATAEAKYQQTSRELAEKTAILERQANIQVKQNEIINKTVPRLISKTAGDFELAEFAHAVYLQPGHSTPLPSVPPDEAMRKFRFRVGSRLNTYQLIAGEIDGKWMLYSYLVRSQQGK
jgi:uncharacterized membrane protein